MVQTLNVIHLVLIREQELKMMAGRIQNMRQLLYDELKKRNIHWNHITTQIGMFGYTGLTGGCTWFYDLHCSGSSRCFETQTPCVHDIQWKNFPCRSQFWQCGCISWCHCRCSDHFQNVGPCCVAMLSPLLFPFKWILFPPVLRIP